MQLKNLNGQWALVTGASSGIGEATAKLLAKNGCHLILIARRYDKLNSLKEKILLQFPDLQIHAFALDLRDRNELSKCIQENQNIFYQVQILINNAGLAKGVESVQNAQWADWETMIDTNITSLMSLTQLLLPHLMQQKISHIVNLGSVAGRWVYPGGAVYCATKFAVRAFTEGLRMDLLGSTVRVTNIEPGMVETEFSEVRLQDKEKAKKVYENMKPLSAFDIAQNIVWCLKQPEHVNIQELVIYPQAQAHVGQVHRHPANHNR